MFCSVANTEGMWKTTGDSRKVSVLVFEAALRCAVVTRLGGARFGTTDHCQTLTRINILYWASMCQ